MKNIVEWVKDGDVFFVHGAHELPVNCIVVNVKMVGDAPIPRPCARYVDNTGYYAAYYHCGIEDIIGLIEKLTGERVSPAEALIMLKGGDK